MTTTKSASTGRTRTTRIAWVVCAVFVAAVLLFDLAAWLWPDFYATARCMTLLGTWVCQ